MATPLLESCPEQLSPEQAARFRTDGYLAFSGVLNAPELQQARIALRELTQRLAKGSPEEITYVPPKTGGKGNGAGAWFQFKGRSCFMQLEPGYDPAGQSLDDIDLKVRKYMHFTGEHPGLKCPVGPGHRMRSIVDGLIGQNPILFQEMALVKPPLIGSEKPWHQDNAYFSVAPLNSIIGVWIALDDATVENGCMHVIPGGHQVGALRHFHGSDCEIVKGRLDTSKAVAVPVPAGGALFFYGLLPHETPANRSPHRRRALQFHFRAADSKIVDEEAYDGIFAEADGTPASCKAASKRCLLTVRR
jgi:hypothetical protein